MRIGITCYPTYGGSGALATELGIALAARGHEVHFITYRQPFRLPSFLPRVWFHEVDVGRYPLFEYPPYDLALAVRMHEVVRDHQLDILHCHYAIPHATSAWIARAMLREEGRDVKVVTTLHGTDITIVGQERSFHTITKFSIEKSHAVTAVSQYLRDETYRAFGCVGCNVEVIPNFVDPTLYDRTRHTFPIPADVIRGRKVLMHISNFRPVKRVRDVVATFARVQEQVPSVLVMVGDGPERVEAEDEARQRGVADNVMFLGKIDAIAPLLAGADCFLLMSDKESFGLSALEAMASGVPVIGYDAGGLPEVVQHGVTGFLHAVGDVEGAAASAIALLSDASAWQRVSTAAAEDARTRFSEQAIVAQYEDLYERTLATADTSPLRTPPFVPAILPSHLPSIAAP
ncbi:N-acetyl-alpha-D-glucosaminyl L-malate synthase BshA [Gemmatimonas sp. UBA7669]|uniref:N-acetyl-alpha-D-glucosaminyl L-malate synthase BshA n=1 Tax=Gemmatimonas sp. UBA7669 TaxID=1946568 RepID=UPI0025B9409E|nr:N-acetyl-alpha-D-glucosaminyl L-malate synthase BshA [Gemmatimonas sp. UBA7669]